MGVPDHATRRTLTRRGFLAAATSGALGVGGAVAATRADRIAPASVVHPARRLAVPARKRWEAQTIGTSVQGRPIVMHRNTTWPARFTLMFVAAIHGDERGAGAIGQHLATVEIPDGVDCYGIPIANPDGWAAGTRNNANDVDLNRNFPWGWRAYDGGRGALTEPESRVLAEVVSIIRPTLIVWIHQPLSYVAPLNSSANEFARIWADAAGLPVHYGVEQGGGAETWCAAGDRQRVDARRSDDPRRHPRPARGASARVRRPAGRRLTSGGAYIDRAPIVRRSSRSRRRVCYPLRSVP